MFTTYEVQAQTKGLNPHVKGDILKLPPISNGRVAVSQHKRSNQTVERLPPAKFSRGLVVNEDYRRENNNQTLADKSFRSLPNSSTHHPVVPKPRHAISAPGRKARTSNEGPQLPQINTLVAGQLTKETENSGARITRRDVPPHAKAVRRRNESNVHIHGHGVPTKDNALKPIENTRKFASSWAGARVDHGFKGSPDPSANFTNVTCTRDEKEEISPGRNDKVKDSFTSTSRSLNKDSKLNESRLYHGVKKKISEPIKVETKNEKPGAVTQHSSFRYRSKTWSHRRPGEGDIGSDKENKDEIPKRRPMSVLPPRRERTRAAMLKKSQSEATVGLKKIRKSQQEKAKEQKALAHNDEAATIYFKNVLQMEQTSVKIEANTDRSKTNNDLSISLIEKQVPPWHRKEYVLTKREADEYKRINTVYGNKTTALRKTRQKQFYETLEKVQLQKWKRDHEEYHQKKMKRKESKHRQAYQLRELRDKFEQEQAKRFANQYVTSRILEHEWLNRHVYGLPENINDEPQYAVKLKNKEKRPKEMFDTEETRSKNVRKFSNIFDIHAGPSWNPHAKPPKMKDNYETFTVEEMGEDGQIVSRTVDVQDILGDAHLMLDKEDEEESPRIESSFGGQARYENDFAQSRETSGDVLKRKSKRKSTVQFKEEPKETKKERRIGVVKRDRSKSPGRKVSTVGSRDPSVTRNGNIDSKRELSRQSATEKKLSTTEKIELKKQSDTRKISTFALLREPVVNSNLHSQHTDSNQNEVEKDKESDKESNKISMDGRREENKEPIKISLNNREEDKESDKESSKIALNNRGEENKEFDKESNKISLDNRDNRGAENKESDKESFKISLDSREEIKESDKDSRKTAIYSREENKESDKNPEKSLLESREQNKDSNKIAVDTREENRESDKDRDKISLDNRGEKNNEFDIESNKISQEFENNSNKISLNNREDKDIASTKESKKPSVDNNAEKNGEPDNKYIKSPLDNNKEGNERSEPSKSPGQISTNLDNTLTASSTTSEAQDKSRNGAIHKQSIKEREDDTVTKISQLVGTPNVKSGTGSASFAGQTELSYNETTQDIDSFKAKQFTPDTKNKNSDIVSDSTNNNAGAEMDTKNNTKVSENQNNTGDGRLSQEKENTNVSRKKEMKPGVKETTVADPKDIEEITVPLGAETEIAAKPSETEKLRSSFTKQSHAPQTNGEPETKHVPNSKDQVSSKDKINGLKPKKKEVSFVEPTKEQEEIQSKQAISKREEMTSKSAALSKKVPVKKDSTPGKKDTSPRRDATPPRKITTVTKPPNQGVSKKESVAANKDTKITPKKVNNEVVPKKLSDTSKTLFTPAKKKASTAKEPATYYINKDNPGVIIQKKVSPKTKPKPITPQMSSKSVVEADKPKPPKISPKPKQPTADREDVDSLDLSDSDDEDIFAKAMRKYGITISDDDDD